MKFIDFENKVRKLIETDIPPGKDALREGRSLAGEVRIGQTRFMKEMGVSSEAEFKRQCIREKRITYHAHIGLNSWDSTAAALNALYEAGQSEGFTFTEPSGILGKKIIGRTIRDRVRDWVVFWINSLTVPINTQYPNRVRISIPCYLTVIYT